MSPQLAEIVSLSERLRTLASQQDWSEMLATARDRQNHLEDYFGQPTLLDPADVIRQAMTAIQLADQTLAAQARTHRQQLLQDAVDLRQRWQMSDTYQRVQNLQT